MPERPDLEYIVPRLNEEILGRTFGELTVKAPVVLRMMVLDPPQTALQGRTITKIERQGGFIVFETSDRILAIHPMLAGRFRLGKPPERPPADLAATFALDDGRVLWFRDDKQMGKVYIMDPGGQAKVPGLRKIGVDVLDPIAFTRAAFRKLAKSRRDQVKSFLLDHEALDHLGNAYSDESLWAAKIHPKARVKELTDAQLDALHDAIVETLTKSREIIAARKPALDDKIRDFLAVRGKKGELCPRCGSAIRTCGLHGHDAFFCPTCQPDNKGRGFVDWRKLSAGGGS